MDSAPSLDLVAAANPFAALTDLPSCMEAHERLARLPQQAYHPLDKPMPAKDSGRPTSHKAGPRDFGVIAAKSGDLDDKATPAVLGDTSDIISISEAELLG